MFLWFWSSKLVYFPVFLIKLTASEKRDHWVMSDKLSNQQSCSILLSQPFKFQFDYQRALTQYCFFDELSWTIEINFRISRQWFIEVGSCDLECRPVKFYTFTTTRMCRCWIVIHCRPLTMMTSQRKYFSWPWIFFSLGLSARALAAYQFKLKHLTRLLFFVYRLVNMSLMIFMNMTKRAAMREESWCARPP